MNLPEEQPMTTETVEDFRNQIREKISEQRELEADIERINQRIEVVRENKVRLQERLEPGERNNYTVRRRELENDIFYAKNAIKSIAQDISILQRRIETIGVGDLVNKIEGKLVEIQGLRRDLVELNQELREEVQRVEEDEEESKRGRSVKWEELEWDIQCTESAIAGISNKVELLKVQLYTTLSERSTRRVTTE